MNYLTCDENGIPILSPREIEDRATAFLRYFAPDCLLAPEATPLAVIAERLQQDNHVNFEWGVSLGYTAGGAKILGQFAVQSKTICIDRDLSDRDPRFRFTIAHELGHFVFHRAIKPAAMGGDNTVIDDSEAEFAINRAMSTRTRNLMEWHANAFAAALLMPRATVRVAVENQQRAMGITRRRGHIYLANATHSHRDYEKIVETLSDLYQVSQLATRIRLEELDLVEIEVPPGLVSIKDILPDAFGEWMNTDDGT